MGSLVSNLGTWLQNTAQVLIAYQLTRSVLAVGVIASAQFAGTILVTPWAAVIADRIGGKSTLIGTQCASALIAGIMAWSYAIGMLGEHSLVVGALALGLAFSLALPVQTAMVPALVGPADTEAAVKMNSVSYNSGRALGPALCVLVFALVGPGLIFTLNAISFAIFAIVLAKLKPLASDGPSRAHADGDGHESPRARVTDGLKIALDNRRILLLLAMVAAVTLADDPILVLSPSIAHTSLHVPSDWAGYFIAALGWGTVLGSLPPTTRRKPADASGASKRAARSLLVLGASIVVFTAGLWTPLCLLAAFVAGGAALITGAAAQSLIVGKRPGAASVAALWAIAWAGTKPFASLLDGLLASNIGIWLTGITLACPALMLAVFELKLPDERKQHIKEWKRT